ncbi:MAG: PAS domain-containing protein [Candidatus Gracilibacteria bacterium]
MLKLTQGHKIAISVAAIFMVSLSIMLFLLGGGSQNLGHVQADVSHSTSNGESEGEGDLSLKLLEEYEAYFEESSDIVFATDAASKFTYASEDFCKLIEENCSLINGKLFFDYVDGKDLADLASTHAKIVKNGNDSKGLGPYRLHKANGDQGPFVMLSTHSILDNEKKVVEIVFSLKDITDKLNEMQKETPIQEEVHTKSSEEVTLPEDDSRPGDTRLMVEKVSFNMRLLSKLF